MHGWMGRWMIHLSILIDLLSIRLDGNGSGTLKKGTISFIICYIASNTIKEIGDQLVEMPRLLKRTMEMVSPSVPLTPAVSL